MKFWLTISLWCLGVIACAQETDSIRIQGKIDSLISEINQLNKQKLYPEALVKVINLRKFVKSTLGVHDIQYARSFRFEGMFRERLKENDLAVLSYKKTLFILDSVGEFINKDYISTLDKLGLLYQRMLNYEDSESTWRRALSIQKELTGKQDSDYAKRLDKLAQLMVRLGRFEEAEQMFMEQKSIYYLTVGEVSHEYANLLNTLGDFYNKQNRYTEAEQILLESLSIFKQMGYGDRFDYAYPAFNLATTYTNLSKYDVAESYYQLSKKIIERSLGKSHPAYGAVLNNLAIFYWRLGRYSKAEKLYRESANMRENSLGKNHPDYAQSINNLGVLYEEMGRFKEADALYREALEIWASTLGTKHPRYSRALMNLAAFNHQVLGNTNKSLEMYNEGLSIIEKKLGIYHMDYAEQLGNIGSLHSDQGRYEKAKEIYYLSLSITDSLVGQNSSYASILNKLGGIALKENDLPKAEEYYQSAVEIVAIEKGENTKSYSTFLTNLGFLNMRLGDLPKADSLFVEALKIRKDLFGTINPDYAETLIGLAIQSKLFGDIERADSLFFQHSRIERKLLADGATYLSEAELNAYAKKFLSYLDEYFSFLHNSGSGEKLMLYESIDNLLFYKGFLLNSMNRIRSLARSDSLTSEKLELLSSQHRLLAKEYTRPETNEELIKKLQDKILLLEKDLAKKVSSFGSITNEIGWEEIQSKLKPNEVAVEFVHFKYCNPMPGDSIIYAAIVILPSSAPVYVPLFEKSDLLNLVGNAKGSRYRRINQLYNHAESGTQLFELIWKPILSQIQNSETLYCSPTGYLNQLNIAALPMDEKHSISEKMNIVLLSSTRELVQQDSIFTIDENRSAVLIGGINYNDQDSSILHVNISKSEYSLENPINVIDSTISRGTPWKNIPETEKEVSMIKDILVSADFSAELLKHDNAKESYFDKYQTLENNSPAILHFATHGYFFEKEQKSQDDLWSSTDIESALRISEDPMMRSGLLLSGSNPAWVSGASFRNDEDGILTSYEIGQLNLSGTKIVVLSACETGLGDITDMEGVFGLQRAFKMAGAEYLIMSLWNVNDKSTREFMTEFYNYWIKENLSIPIAFKQAQIFIKSKYPDSPYLWAPFVLMQ